MAAVFPESMDRLNVQDPTTALSIVEQYIAYMTERIEFSMRNMTKTVSAAGISSAEMYILIQAQAQVLANLQSAMSIVQGSITALQGNMTTAQADITAIKARLGTFADSDPTVKESLDSLEQSISDQGLSVVDGKLCQTYVD